MPTNPKEQVFSVRSKQSGTIFQEKEVSNWNFHSKWIIIGRSGKLQMVSWMYAAAKLPPTSRCRAAATAAAAALLPPRCHRHAVRRRRRAAAKLPPTSR